MAINFDNIGADWTFDYGATVLTKPYSGKPYITCSSTEVAISGTIQSLVLKCQSDIDSLEQWFIDGSKLVTCPVFYTAPISFEGVTSYYDQATRSISWTNSPYSYSGAYYTGTNADGNFNVLDPLEPVFFKLNIVPVERGYRYYQPTPNSPRQIDAIPFIVLPRLQPETFYFKNSKSSTLPTVYDVLRADYKFLNSAYTQTEVRANFNSITRMVILN